MKVVEDLVSIPEAADMLHIDRSRVGRLCRQGRFEGARKIGGRWVIPRESVIHFERRGPGVPPRKGVEKELITQALKEADNLKKEETDNDKQ